MSKVRVYELAKEYGLKGPTLAKMLKEHGFEKVKSHMAVLDDATALHARAVLEAQGMQAASKAAPSPAPAAPPQDDGLPRKKQLPKAGGDEPVQKPLPKPLPRAGDVPAKKPLPTPDAGPAKKPLPEVPSAEAASPTAPAAETLAAETLAAETLAAKTDDASATKSEPADTPAATKPQPAAKVTNDAPTQGQAAPAQPKPEESAAEKPMAVEPQVPADASAPKVDSEASDTRPPASKPAAAQTDSPPNTGAADTASASPPDSPSTPVTDTPSATAVPTPTASQAAAQTGAPQRSDAPRRTDAPARSDAPRRTDAPARSDAPRRTDAPARSDAPRRTDAPARSDAPRRTDAPARSDAPQRGTAVPRTDVPAPAAGDPNRPAAAGDPKQVKRLIMPEAKAKVVGRIELSPEAIRDAQRRSSPGGAGRGGPGGAGRDLRRGALRSIQSRSASGRGGPPQRGGPGMRRGPGVGGRGRAGGRSGRRGPTQNNLSSTVDPNKVIEIEPPITVKALSEAIGVRINDLIATLTFKLGVIGKNINSFLTNDEIELVGMEVKRNIKLVERKQAEEELLQTIVDAREDVDSQSRSPVVTFMGHVDHGKTTLLDAFRKSSVTAGEAGGITQHVGAYKIFWGENSGFVILDTPGHAAFTQMRARGAKITDIVVLIVAADDGVMPQTEEAIAHAKEADVQIIVAITKCDRPESNPMQVRQQLAVKGLQPEDWGGDIPVVEVSAVSGQGMDDLVEQIMLRAEVAELSAKPDVPAEAVVIESKQTPEQGVTVNVLVTNGTLRLRDQVLCGESLSRVRGIVDDRGQNLSEASPSTPVQLLGITSLPLPGDKLYVVNDKKKAKEVVEDRERHARRQRLAERSAQTLENLQAKLQAKEIAEIKVILKADVMGSLEPIKTSLGDLGTDEVRVNVIHAALGGITETDVSLAEASGAMIIGFNSVADSTARQAADRAGVDIRFYSVIYELVDEVKLALEGELKPDEVESALGSAEIRAVFRSSKFGNIAGCYVTDGVVRRNAFVRMSRDGKVVYQGTVSSLRRESEDAKEVRSGFECGMTLKDYNDIKEGDRLDFYEITLVKRTLE